MKPDKHSIPDSLYSDDDLYLNSILNKQETSSIVNILTYLLKILKYWYLFVIALLIAFGLAFLKNKSWIPVYKSATTILIEDNRSGIGSKNNDLTSGFYSMGYSSRNNTNQMIMYMSHDFISKVVDKLDINYDIYLKERFKNINLYKRAPVLIENTYIANQVYGLEFKIEGIDEKTYKVSYVGSGNIPAFELTGNYGVPLQHSLFFINVTKTDFYVEPVFEIYTKFYSKNSLINNFRSRLFAKILMEGSSVLEISMTGQVAQRDVDFLNLLNEQFFEENLERKNLAAERSINFIDNQISIIRDSIDSSEAKLNSYQLSSGMYSQDKSASKSRVIDDLDQRRAELRLRKEYVGFLAGSLNQSGELLTDPSAMGITNPQLSGLISKYNTLVTEMKTLGSGSPIYSRNQRTMEDIRTNIREVVNTMSSSIRIEEENISQRYGKALGEIASLPQQERKLLTYERDFKLNDTYYTYLLQKRTENQIQKASNAPDNLIVDNPRVVQIINRGDKNNTYLIYLIVGLLLPLIFVVCKEFLFKFSIQSRDEVERITKFPILGTIEHTKRKQQVIVKKYPASSFTEGFRNLRSRMEFIAKKESPISMLITSTEPQDGKTLIALNLASIYQIAGKRVIVVDFDLRRPLLSKSLGLEDQKGLSNCLIDQITLDEAIIAHPEYDFDVLPAGIVPPNPSELISTDKTKEILNELYKRYDYLILDCSPVGLVSDAHFLSRLVDVVLYVVRNEKTNKNFLKYTIKELREDGINNISIIYNDVNVQGGYYANQRYYGKSSYYMKHSSYYHNEEE